MYCGVESAAVRPGVCRVRAWTPRQTKTEPAFFAAGPAVHPAQPCTGCGPHSNPRLNAYNHWRKNGYVNDGRCDCVLRVDLELTRNAAFGRQAREVSGGGGAGGVSVRDRACGNSRVHGGAATWPSLAAVAVCGGVQKRNIATRVGCEACRALGALGGLTCHCALPLATGQSRRGKNRVFHV